MGGYSGAIRNAGAMDDAAVCVVAASPMAECTPLIKDKLCTIFCCCKKHPIAKKGSDRRYMQLCADAMLTSSDANKAGVLNSVPYDMGKNPPEPISRPNYKARTAQIYKSEESDADMYGSDPIFLTGKVRIPDVVVLKDSKLPPIQDNIAKIYDFKFPGDRWRGTQREDYQKIQGKDGPDVEALDEESCKCAKRDKDDSENMNVQAMADAKAKANEALERIFTDTTGQYAYNRQFGHLNMGAVREELERQARYNTTPPWVHKLYGTAVVTAATGGVGTAIFGGAGAATVGGAVTRATVTQFVPRVGQAAVKVAPELSKAAGVIPWFMPEMDK